MDIIYEAVHAKIEIVFAIKYGIEEKLLNIGSIFSFTSI